MNRPLCAILTVVSLVASLAGAASGAEPSFSPPARAQSWAPGVSSAWLHDLNARIAAATYDMTVDVPAVVATNQAHHLRATFAAEGISVAALAPAAGQGASAWRWTWRTLSWGRGDARLPVGSTDADATGRLVTLRHGALTEWYENAPRGLEQAFTLSSPPAGTDPVCIQARLSTDGLVSRTGEDGVVFRDASGRAVLQYGGLVVRDARGRRLPSSVAYDAGHITLSFDDHGAQYPVVVDPLLTSPAWTTESNQISAYFGTSVSTAGDVNGDGYSDVLVGADFYDNGQTDEGRAFLYLGSASGLAPTPAWTAESDQSGANMGGPLSYAGDVNGDGYDDVIVGAHGYSNGQSSEGRAFVYLGSASGLSATAAWTTESDQAGANYGYGVSAAGDVNGDGYADVLVGAPNFDNGQTDEGRAYLYLGSASGLATTAAWTAEGNQVNVYFGTRAALTSAGDVNADGYDDVIVGAPNFDNTKPDEGAAYVYLGSASGLAATPAWTTYSNSTSALYGQAVNAAGDVNGDGYADVIVGAVQYTNGQTQEGRAWVYLGSATGPSLTSTWAVESNQGGALYGHRVATAGDVNGDGFADVLVDAPLYDNGQTDEGRAFLYLGGATGLSITPAWVAESNQPGAETGWWLGTAGDVNGDGFSDVILGTVFYDGPEFDEGQASVYYGSGDGPAALPAWFVSGSGSGDNVGRCVASAGDINGDGYSDALVGVSGLSQVWVYLGSATGLAPTASVTLVGPVGSSFGFSCASAGDVNGDGYGDVIVGAWGMSNPESNEGTAFLYLGSSSGLATTSSWSYESNNAIGYLGWSVASAGDVNGDGFSDAVIGAPTYSGDLGAEGRAYLFLGAASGLAATPAWSPEGDEANSDFGYQVGTAGDVNGDGFSDVVVGKPRSSNETGSVSVYAGSPAGLSATPSWTLSGPAPQSWFGASCATAGDVNADGFSDIIVGAYQYSNGQTQEGAAYAYLGSPGGLAGSWSVEGNSAFVQLGSSVAYGGDVNADGYSDVLVGVPGWSNGQSNEGQALTFLGSASGLAATPISAVESNKAQAALGTSVAGGGDVNGDGFSDVLTGAPGYNNGSANNGRAFLAYGGGSDGLDRIPRQRRLSDAAPIGSYGRSDSPQSFLLRALGRTAAGRARVRIEWEAKTLGSPFVGGIVPVGTWIDTGPSAPGVGSAVSLSAVVGSEVLDGGLLANTAYHWRLRVASSSPLFPRTPWLTQQANASTETDLRTAMPVAIPPLESSPPDGLRLVSARPISTSGVVTLTYTLPRTGKATLAIYDAAGRHVDTLIQAVQAAGEHRCSWMMRDDTGSPVSPGIYLARLTAEDRTCVLRIVALK